ncbi:MAG: HAD-IA family hydrolase [Myxococcales bacterium]|nr:HAD-IA family hydrolase [Myxococcales bacterium]
MTIEATLFDCDGTLVDSERLTSEVLAAYAAELDVAIGPDEALAEITGAKLADVVASLQRRASRPLPDDFVPEFRRRQAEAFGSRLEAIPGAAELLDALSMPCCVASSAPREKIELSLRLTGLRHHFHDRIYSAYDIERWKPDPGLFLHAARQMGVAPERCAVVEDSRLGIEAGVAAGMQVFAYWPGEAVPALPAGVVRVARLAELHGALVR